MARPSYLPKTIISDNRGRVKVESKDKIKWLLKNKGRAISVSENLEARAENMTYGLPAKTAVGGSSQQSKSESGQESYISKKEEIEERAMLLQANARAIKRNVEELPQRQGQVIKLRYYEDFSFEQTANKLYICRSTAMSDRDKAFDTLEGWGLPGLYPALKYLLDD